jgi:predicted nucleic acid-binding protein
LIVGARVPYSEDLQDGQIIDGQLRVENPFRKPPTGINNELPTSP